MRMHIHISLPRRLRSGMRSIARRIESGPTRGRERPGANEGKSERTKRRASERDRGNKKEIREERERDMKKGEIEGKRYRAKDREGKGKDQKRRDVERRRSRIRAQVGTTTTGIEGAKEKRSREAGGRRIVGMREKENAHGSRKRQQLLRALPLESPSA